MSALRSSRGDRESSPPRTEGIYYELVKDLARVRDTDPAKYPAAHEKLKVCSRRLGLCTCVAYNGGWCGVCFVKY